MLCVVEGVSQLDNVMSEQDAFGAAEEGAQMPTRRVDCNVCYESKMESEFDRKGLARGFYWRAPPPCGRPRPMADPSHGDDRHRCKRCQSHRKTEQRRTDPACRLAARVRMREKRRGCVLQLRADEIRRLLATEDPRLVAEDLVDLVRLRAREPLRADNVAVRRLGVVVQ